MKVSVVNFEALKRLEASKDTVKKIDKYIQTLNSESNDYYKALCYKASVLHSLKNDDEALKIILPLERNFWMLQNDDVIVLCDILKDIYFESLIDVALGENEAGGIKKKPAKDMVMSALEKLDSTQEKSIYVGDSEVDSQTAVNSGLDCILVSWGFRTKDILEKLTYKKIIDEPMELLDVIA